MKCKEDHRSYRCNFCSNLLYHFIFILHGFITNRQFFLSREWFGRNSKMASSPGYKGTDTAAGKRAFNTTDVLKRQYFTLTIFTVDVHGNICCCAGLAKHPSIHSNLIDMITSSPCLHRDCHRQLQNINWSVSRTLQTKQR